MNIELPIIPAGVLMLLALFAPYVIGALNGVLLFIAKPWQKKALAIAVAVVLAVLVLAFYYLYTGDALPEWPVLVLLAVVVVQASYALITKPTASAVERHFTSGETLRRDIR
ncbi:hypothetical protein [Microbacterium aurantiacum]|uniref:hypothetical protein n=1 Tax=Microbacterium aurantiacum TaxID=162393 RepID=UPI000C7FA0C3|nr:hypothetical protein [Microbacterium aurantiacum]